MMKIAKSTIPAGSLVEEYLPVDYSDVFACGVVSEVATEKRLSPDDIMVAFWTGAASPGWVRALFRLRHFLVRFVGLKGSDDMNPSDFEAAIRSGGTFGFASVAAKSPNETVLLLTDKHLDAWISIHIVPDATGRETVSAVTLVRFKNMLGRVYFFVIRPFHALVVKTMLRRAINTLL